MPEQFDIEEVKDLSIDAQILADEIEAHGHKPDYYLTPRHARIFGKHIKGDKKRGFKHDFKLGNTLVRVKKRGKTDERHRP